MIVTPVFESITVEDTDQKIVVVEERVEILSVGVMGPPGPAGEPGASANDPWHEDVFSLSGNQTVFVLAEAPRTGTTRMFVNGLYQASSNFSVLDDTVTVTGFTPTTDDEVSFVYQAEV